MSWFSRTMVTPFRRSRRNEQRAISSVPWSSGGYSSQQVSAERALSLVPVYACVRLLSSSVASLPVQVYRREGADRTPLVYLPSLLWQPAAIDNLYQWLSKLMVSLTLRGNAYGLITQRDSLGFPVMVEWLNPDDVWVDELNPIAPVYYWRGRVVDIADMIHIPWVTLPGRVVGLSPIAHFASTIGVGLSTVDYGKSWFDNGGTPPATMKNNARTINPDEAKQTALALSSAVRLRRPLVYGQDWDYTALQVSPEESQFIETLRLNATQIATIYGVPPSKVGGETGGSMTYASVEMASIDFVTFTLRPWLVLLESKLSTLLPGRIQMRFNADAMIRTSTLDRYTAHGMALAQGWRNRDEIRALEELPPLPDGQGQAYGPQPLPAPAPADPERDDEGSAA
ncbi:phage portal protein [Streptomyces sp. PA03-6a]|nr:phage portal protein [Streptomyces sp. PA03-6a]